jgi:hypothetical protein
MFPVSLRRYEFCPKIGQSHLQIISALNSVALCAPLASVLIDHLRTLRRRFPLRGRKARMLIIQAFCLNAIALCSKSANIAFSAGLY